MAHVGDVAHVAHLVPEVAQQLLQHVVGYARAGVAQMGVAVHRRAAHVHSHATLVDRGEQFLAAGKGVCQIKRSHIDFFLFTDNKMRENTPRRMNTIACVSCAIIA